MQKSRKCRIGPVYKGSPKYSSVEIVSIAYNNFLLVCKIEMSNRFVVHIVVATGLILVNQHAGHKHSMSVQSSVLEFLLITSRKQVLENTFWAKKHS